MSLAWVVRGMHREECGSRGCRCVRSTERSEAGRDLDRISVLGRFPRVKGDRWACHTLGYPAMGRGLRMWMETGLVYGWYRAHTAPAGSWMTQNRPPASSLTGTTSFPPSSAHLAALFSTSSTMK